VFSDIYVSMIRAGEVSGQIDIILTRLAEYLEAAAHLRSEIKSAMTYPVVSLFLVFGIAGFLMIGIVPSFKPVFESLEVELPALTVWIMDAAFFLKAYWWMISSGRWRVDRLLDVEEDRQRRPDLDKLMLRAPVFGSRCSRRSRCRASRARSRR
jgi:type II secretory pathway component PulF